MARVFTKIGKEIEIAVKAGGSDPSGNTRLRILIQNAKAENMPDNTNRTVASLRMYFNKCGGTLGTSGSVAFMFEHKCVFKFRVPAGTDLEELELEMIDLEVDEFYPEEDTITVYAPYESFGAIQKWIEDKGFETISGESVRIPVDTKELSAEERESVEKLQERIEEDDDVVNVYTNMREPEDDEADEE